MVGQESVERGTHAQKTPVPGEKLFKRKLPIGAETTPTGVHFRVWAPNSRNVSVQLISSSEPKVVALESESDGYFSGLVTDARAGMLYKFQLDSGAFPDPASRFQPEGPHGPSQIIDPNHFRWTDDRSEERRVGKECRS